MLRIERVPLSQTEMWGERGKDRQIETYPGSIYCAVPDHSNKAKIAIKQVTRIFSFSSAYITFTLYCSKYAITFCLGGEEKST